jgi:hypothetical protein
MTRELWIYKVINFDYISSHASLTADTVSPPSAFILNSFSPKEILLEATTDGGNLK